MRKLLYLFLLVLLAPLSAEANQAVRGWCEAGAQPVVTSGLNSTTKVQASFPQCSVSVFIHGGGLASVFSDNSGTPLANPFTAQTNGQWQFYAANGHYDVTLTFTGGPSPVTYNDILVTDPANQQAAIPNTILTFSATPDFPSTNNASYTFTLTGNVTSSTASGTPANGNILSLTLTEDAIGGRTMVFPTSFILPLGFSFNTLANATNALTWKFDGTNWNLISNTGSGGGSNPSPPVNALQKNNGAGALGASSITDDGTNVIVGENSRFKGPNPYIDATTQNIRAIDPNQPPAINGVTVTTTSGQATVTISAASTFKNNDGVRANGAGAAQSMATPVISSITNVVARGPTGTTDDVPGPAGSNTTCYRVLAEDQNGGMTAASGEVCTSTGQTLGSNTVSLTTCSMSNNTMSCTTSSAHTMAVGAWALILAGVADNATYGGVFQVATVPDNTHFTAIRGLDTRNGPVPVVSPSFTATVTWFNANQIAWGQITNAYIYRIYCGGTGAEILCGMSWPVNGGTTDGTLSWDDWGATMLSGSTTPIPDWVPNTPPASATSDNLVTTIVSGAGTTSLVLAQAAGTSVNGATIRFDNAPNIVTAASAAANQDKALVFPYDASGFSYVVNSIVDLSNVGAGGAHSAAIVVPGGLNLNNTLILGQGGKLVGTTYPPTKLSVSSGGFEGLVPIACKASPCIFIKSGFNAHVEGVSLSVPSGGIGILQDNGGGSPGTTYDRVGLNGGTDSMSIGFLARGVSGGSSPFQIRQMSAQGGAQQAPQASSTPFFYGDITGSSKVVGLTLNGRGICIRGGANVSFEWVYMQGGSTPLFTLAGQKSGGNSANNITLAEVVQDTMSMPLFTAVNGVGSNFGTYVRTFNIYGAPQTNMPHVSGRTDQIVFDAAPLLSGQNVNTFFHQANGSFGSGSVDGFYVTNGAPLPYANTILQEGFGTGPGYPVFISDVPMAAPTIQSIGAGGNVPVGTHTYVVRPVWQNGGEGSASATSANATTTTGNQTVNLAWTPYTGGGCKGYDMYRDGLRLIGAVPNIVGCGTSTFADTIASAASGTAASFPTGGPAMLTPQGSVAGQSLVIGGANGLSTQTTLSTASRSIIWPDAGGTPAFINNPQTWTSPQSFSNGNTLRFFGPNGVNWTALTGPGSNPASNVTFQLPSADSTGVQCLSSNGSGVMAFSACSGGTGTPGGALTQLQFFAAGPTFGGSPNLTWVSPALTIGVNASATGQLMLANGGASGASVTVQNNAATVAYNFNLPTTAGTAGFPLLSQGGGASPMTFATLGAGAGGTGLTSWGTNQIVYSTGGTGVLANLSSSTITNTAGGTQLKIQPSGAAGTALALDTAASPSGDIEDLNINGTKSAWFDSSAILHVPQMTTTGSGPAVVSGPEGNCPAAVNGSDILCLGDSTAHTGKLSDNGVAFKSIVLWFNDNPNFHGVMTVGSQFPQANFTSPGTLGQAFISGGPSADGAYGTLNPVGGGTGLTTIPAHGVMLGEGTSVVAVSGPDATANQPLLSVSATADPVFGALPLGDANAVSGTLSIPHGGTGSTTLAGANIVTVSGSFTTGNCVKSSASTVTIDAGAPCGVANAATQFSVPYYSLAGSNSTLSGLAAPTTPNTVPQFLVSTPSGGVATAPTFNFFAVPVNAQTGTTYTVAATDRFSFLTQNNAAAIATTLPQAGTTNFTQNFSFLTKTTGAGANTITPTTSTINGAATLLVPQNWLAMVFSDNTNYFAARVPDYAGFPNCGDATHGLGFATATGVFNCQAITGSAAAGGSNTQIQYNNATALGGITQWTTNGTTTMTEGATGVLDLSAGAPTAALKLPTSAGAAPTADSFLGFDSTGHGVVFGSNGSTAGVVFNTANFTSGDLIQANGNHVSIDSGIAAANVPTAASSAAAAKQIAVSGGANKTLNFIDMSETFYVPAANCVNAVAASAWSAGATPAPLCRAGTNNKDGLLSPWGASDVGYFKVHLPNDWDSGASLDISIDLTSTDTVNAHTIIMQASTVCGKGDGSTTDDVAFNTAQSFGTITLNGNANRTWNATLTGLTKTGCTAGSTLWIKISRTTDTATNVGVYGATVDVARLLTVQAN